MEKIPNRAETYEEKKLVMEKLLEVWAKYPDLRLGQLIISVIYKLLPPTALHSAINIALNIIEDSTLVEKVVEFDKAQALERAIKASSKKE
ncbi:MAG TPA: hypothetical protein VII94_03575 [Candidatus Saccharimonadales bacterium]